MIDNTNNTTAKFNVNEEAIIMTTVTVKSFNLQMFAEDSVLKVNVGDITFNLSKIADNKTNAAFLASLNNIFGKSDPVKTEDFDDTAVNSTTDVVEQNSSTSSDNETVVSNAAVVVRKESLKPRITNPSAKILADLVQFISVNSLKEILFVKVGRKGIIVRHASGISYYATANGEKKGIIPSDLVKIFESDLETHGCYVLKSAKEIDKYVKRGLEVFGAEVRNKGMLENAAHEYLEREGKAFYITSLELKVDTPPRSEITKHDEVALHFDDKDEFWDFVNNKYFAMKEAHKDRYGQLIYHEKDLTVTQRRVRVDLTRTLLSCAWNRKSDYLPIHPANTVLLGHGTSKPITGKVDRYTHAMLQLIIRDTRMIPYIVKMVDGKIVPRTIYKFGCGEEESFLVGDPYDDKYMYSLTSGERYNKMKFIAKYGKECIRYNTAESGNTITAGQLKRGSILLYAENLPDFNPQAMMDELTYGAYNVALTGGHGTAKDVAQLANRMGQIEATAKPLGHIGNVCFFMGKFIDGEGNEFIDGLAFWASEHAARTFNKNMPRFNASKEILEGSAAQMRPGECKTLAAIVDGKLIVVIAKRFSKDFVVIVRSKVTPEQQKAFNDCFSKTTRETSPYWHKNILITDSEPVYDSEGNVIVSIDFYTDLNGLKCPFDLSCQTACNVLKFSSQHKSLEKGSTLSSQLISSLCTVDPEATKALINRLGDAFINDKMTSIGYSKDANGKWMFKTPERRDIIGYDLISENSIMDVSTLMPVIAPKITAEVWMKSFQNIADQIVEGLTNSTSELSYPTKGIYAFIVPDYLTMISESKLLGVREGGVVECFSPAMTKAETARAIGVKFPKMGLREFSKFVNVSLDEIGERLENLKQSKQITQEEATLIFNSYKNVSPGVVIIPSVAILKNLLAGMDFDGDCIQLYWDEDIIKMLWDVEPVAVVIDPPAVKENTPPAPKFIDDRFQSQYFDILDKPDDDKITSIDCNVGLWSLINFTVAANKSVGEVTNVHHLGTETVYRITKLLQIKDSMTEEAWTRLAQKELKHITLAWQVAFGMPTSISGTSKFGEFWKNIRKNQKHEDRVDNILVHYIDESATEDFMTAARYADKCDMTSLTDAANILMELGRNYQELTVDDAKNARGVTIPYFDDLSKVKYYSKSRGNFDIKITWGGKEETARLKEEQREEFENSNRDIKSAVVRRFKNYASYIWNTNEDRALDEDGKDAFKTKKPPKVVLLKDNIHAYRTDFGMKVVEVTNVLGQRKITIPDAFKKEVAELARGNEKYRFMFEPAMREYGALTTIGANVQAKYSEIFGGEDKEMHESRMKAGKKFCDIAYKVLTDNLRTATEHLDPVHRAAIALQMSIERNNSFVCSNFCQDILPEEFVLLMLYMEYKLYNETAIKVQEHLYECRGFNPGDKVRFKDGVAEGNNGECAIAKNKINGVFIIAFNADESPVQQFCAEMKVSTVLRRKIKCSHDKVLFMTKMSVTDARAAEYAKQRLVSGKEVMLVPYAMIDGKKLGDAVIVDKEEVIHYRGTAPLDPKNRRLQIESKNVINNTIGNVKGRVAYCVDYDVTITAKNAREGMPAGVYIILACVLEDIRPIDKNEDLKGIKRFDVSTLPPMKVAKERPALNNAKIFKDKVKLELDFSQSKKADATSESRKPIDVNPNVSNTQKATTSSTAPNVNYKEINAKFLATLTNIFGSDTQKHIANIHFFTGESVAKAS